MSLLVRLSDLQWQRHLVTQKLLGMHGLFCQADLCYGVGEGQFPSPALPHAVQTRELACTQNTV